MLGMRNPIHDDRPAFGFSDVFGGGGGSSSSTASNTTTTTNTTTNVDASQRTDNNQAVADNGSIIAREGGSVVVNSLDGGVIKGGLDTVNRAADLAFRATQSLIDAVTRNNERSIEAVQASAARSSDNSAAAITALAETRGATDSAGSVKLVAWLAAGVLVLFFLFKGRK